MKKLTTLISQLRSKIPIGVIEAKKLIIESNGNLLNAENQWKENKIQTLSQALNISKSNSKELLIFVKFDIDKANSLFKEDETSVVEKIISTHKKKSTALANFSTYCHFHFRKEEHLEYWTQSKKFNNLPSIIKEIILVEEWYKYFLLENYSVEQGSTTKVIEILKTKLNMPSFALEIKKFNSYIEAYWAKVSLNKLSTAEKVDLSNTVRSSFAYQKHTKIIAQHEDLVNKNLTDYILKNANTINNLLKKQMIYDK